MPFCRAKSSRTGQPCKQRAVLGTTVCRMHGASAPQVRAAAEQRLLAMVLPALATIKRVVESGESDAVALAAARDVLDRVGMSKAAVKVDSAVQITVRYEDRPLPAPERSQTRQNGAHALNGD